MCPHCGGLLRIGGVICACIAVGVAPLKHWTAPPAHAVGQLVNVVSTTSSVTGSAVIVNNVTGERYPSAPPLRQSVQDEDRPNAAGALTISLE